MTPGQIAEFCGHGSRKSEGFDCICDLLERFRRAALRERDAAWAAAVRIAGAVIATDGSIFLMPGGDDRALRALLEEAGSNEK